jgi:hypothetical protein
MMDRQMVKSSNLKSIGYDQSSNILEIEFLSGQLYQYFKVPSQIYLALMKATSKGSYFHANIKEKYEYNHIS